MTRHNLVPFLAALLLLPVVALGSTPPAASQSAAANAAVPKVTIESARQRQALRRQVNQFAASVVAQQGSESIVRWNEPVCPLVAGLPRNFGEFILARISQAARTAGAPLAGSSCRANLFVIATAHPDVVLKKWLAQDPDVDTRDGVERMRRFLASTRPIRVWYNTVHSCDGAVSNGVVAAAGLNATMGDSNPSGNLGPSYCQNSMDTHLSYGDVRLIYSAIVVIDTGSLERVTIGQLADYVSLVGLVKVRPDTDGEGAPTILRLFRDPSPPQALTPWDRALLYSLYNTNQSGKLQLVDMESVMVGRIAR
ncbi:MAG: hypothetical protein ACREV7_11890 [Steroidobacteraceae bacterium]